MVNKYGTYKERKKLRTTKENQDSGNLTSLQSTHYLVNARIAGDLE
jgi:hypothetical protein